MLRNLRLIALLTGSLLACFEIPALAQSRPIQPHVTADFNTPRNGDGDRSFTQLSGFLPISQTPDVGITFLGTSARIDTDGNFGGNVAIGHRQVVDDLMLGGYLSYDVRDTGRRAFNQVGMGVEVFGDRWDVHLNGYLPVGDTSVPVGNIASSGTVQDVFFEANQLFVSTEGLQEFETALAGADLEAGIQLGSFDEYGDLWGYGSVYLLGDSVGGSVRLDHRVQNRFRTGLGVQSDGISGTQVFFSVGVGFGGSPRSNQDDSKDEITESIWTRAAENHTRNSSIFIDNEMRRVSQTEVAINPDTGKSYAFQHVIPDSANAGQGDGTYENPFATLGTDTAANTALGAASTGDIVYVNAGDSRANSLPSMTIPTGVQVRSDAFTEQFSTQFGDIALPNSDTRVLPLINSSLSLLGNEVNPSSTGIILNGDDTLISGFEITGNATGIIADNSDNAVIQNNLIGDNSLNGIMIDGSNNINVQDNWVRRNGGSGLFISDVDGANIQNNLLTSNDAAGVTAGVFVIDSSDVNVEGNMAIANDNGISIESSNDVSVRDNKTNGNFDTGIFVSGVENIVIEDNTAASNLGGGIFLGASDNATMQRNTANQNDGTGILVTGSEATVIDNSAVENGGNNINIIP